MHQGKSTVKNAFLILQCNPFLITISLLQKSKPMKPDFQISFNKSMSAEGFISNNKSDKGGFTYKGISHVMHPAWPGWKIIDAAVAAGNTSQLKNNEQLNKFVEDFYLSEFWNKIKGDALPSQLIANELFDSSINLGVSVASEFLQKTINLLNRNGSLYPDIKVDGIIGSQTLAALNKCIAANGEKLVFNLLNFYQAKRYIEIMERDGTQEIFIGWFSRIDIIK